MVKHAFSIAGYKYTRFMYMLLFSSFKNYFKHHVITLNMMLSVISLVRNRIIGV